MRREFMFDHPCAAHTMGRGLCLSPVGFAAHGTPLRGLRAVFLLLLFLSSRLSQRMLGSMDPSFDTRGRWGGGTWSLARAPISGQGFPFRF